MKPVNLGRRQLFAVGAAAGMVAVTGVAGGAARADPPGDDSRYPGYSPRDRAQPYAKYMADRTDPALPAVLAAYAGDPTPAASIPEFGSLTDDLAPSGYSAVETGYGQIDSGIVWVAAHTPMPGITARMWDWWFGWHLYESARYKLWHPDAHMYAEVDGDESRRPSSGPEGYIGKVSYVDEYIGARLQQLAISFRDPVAHGFRVPEGHTVIFGRVGSSVAPLDLGWLVHQVRPTAEGCEMRSRFYLRLYGAHAPDAGRAGRAVRRGAAVDPRDLFPGTDMARDLLLHCGQEMHHLAGFLPRLYAEFGD
ncbi:DAPG hydrolase family protein [Nocardia arizonensis]|uniref:DAPG hydrolase family protein n=1 Tax=Nocardia arizonensis TaxID=1141647 RepID=UPI0006CF69C0|nr:hypothetical protein [Nocardia arizonensis]